MIIRATKSDFLNTLMVTSSVGGEGKTLTAINLAISMAQEIDHSILLVDADLRKPAIHHYLGISIEHGLSDYLSGDAELKDLLIRTGIGKLVFLPAGRKIENPVELLSSGRMRELIKELKHRYADRYIIIDTPPIMPFAEALAIGSYVDGVVFVVREGYAQRRTVEEAINLINSFKILGVVFNAAKIENLDGHYARYSYKYKYSYKKGRKK
jgi:exopolysaccharide/PEP-CTERM locus tyrosine autokinase